MNAKLTATPTTQRKSNIELLRIIAMIMVVAHHVAVHSDFFFPNEIITVNRLWIQLLQIGGKVGVNVFVLISGYFLVPAKTVKANKAVKLWMQIFSYSAGICLLFVAFGGEAFGVRYLFPVAYTNWWFASSYFVLYLLSPYINRLIGTFDKKAYQRFLLLLGFFWCILPTFLTRGWESSAFTWCVFLYALAGYIRLYVDMSKIKKSTAFLATLILTALTYLSAVFFDVVGTKMPFVAEHATYFFSMERLPVLLISVALFLGFLNVDVGYKPLINIISAATFGVYLIHDNNFVRKMLWHTLFKNASYADSSFLIPYTIAQVVIVFVVCTAIELFRIHVIERFYLKFIDRFVGFVQRMCNKIASSGLVVGLKKHL